MVLFLHNRYRTTGGEERVVDDLLWLVREHLGEAAELLTRDSATLGRGRAAIGLLRGGLDPEEVARAVRLGGARVVHAHNLQPALGWRALAAARAARARVVLHLHQYRLVCAIGVCFTRGAECTRCHGRDTLPGVRLNCRGSLPEAVAYGASLALWQRRLVEQADAVIVPSAFARERLRELGAPLPWERVHVLAPRSRAAAAGRTRSCRGGPTRWSSRAWRPRRASTSRSTPAGWPASRWWWPARARAGGAASERAGDGDVRFVGRVDDAELAELRAGAAIALAPSRSAETFGLAAAEAMAAGLPVAASRVGALPELVDEEGLVPAGDAGALAQAITRLAGDRVAGERGVQRVRALCAPEVVAGGLAALYDGEDARASRA